MSGRHVPQRGDVYWIDPNPIAVGEIKDRHRFAVITPKEVNALDIAMAPLKTAVEWFQNPFALSLSKGNGFWFRTI